MMFVNRRINDENIFRHQTMDSKVICEQEKLRMVENSFQQSIVDGLTMEHGRWSAFINDDAPARAPFSRPAFSPDLRTEAQ